ncbi:MAG TPA: efflux RND transporter periplasmic adaptor subunit [Flavobacteriaceae bacterium]|nr:efflux RND transporter periplasmic adaptor subunit [Flavobacteriaceae bacterium]MCB9211884.1 efflux RND transporter periplasmic adaptor subunit [Alteromonas sp.]HPF10022.1 efflux RND transporter periplasmic adaptor subunit [Flavobacteriaceae bacterium]HQU21321.1 efflux RND transporter periplasmic adaptor subunit [Flavobacteriaceae bacterium]HQU63895.1 efflux RND transporter periplasmic adaptor subunit [Flavobacteriaceae bacterium]
MKKYPSLTILAFVIATTLSCGNDSRNETNNIPPIPVTIQTVDATSNNPFLTVSGKIQSVNSADLSTRMMGFVHKIHVKVGEKVKKGQLLISINNTDLQAKLAQVNAGILEATAAYNNAKKDYERFQNLFAENSASQKELDDMTARFEMAKARLEAANQMKNEVSAQFAYANITAPFSGIVTGKTIDEGSMANPGMPLISMEAPGAFEVQAFVPESEINKIKNGGTVSVFAKSIEKTLQGTISEVSISAKNTAGQYLVKIALAPTDIPILAGMFVTVQFPVEKTSLTTSNQILVPENALVREGQLTGLYTLGDGDIAILRWLRVGKNFGEQVEILSGLKTGESYIVSADGKLYNGAKISVQ